MVRNEDGPGRARKVAGGGTVETMEVVVVSLGFGSIFLSK